MSNENSDATVSASMIPLFQYLDYVPFPVTEHHFNLMTASGISMAA